MSDGQIIAIGVGIVAALWCSCGTFFAWLFGIRDGITWLLFVVAWPVPLSVCFLLAVFALTTSISLARALVR